MATLTGKTIGELTALTGVTNDTIFAVELSGVTYHLPYSAFTLTGDVTGTTVSNELTPMCVDVEECTNELRTEWINCPISFESSALTTGVAYFPLKVPFKCNVIEYAVSVVEEIESTDDATVKLFNNLGNEMGSSTVVVTKGTKPSTSSPASSSNFNSSNITSNNGFTGGQILSIKVEKTTPGGRAFVTLKVRRTV